MMMFILGMLVMYLIVGVIVALDEIFGEGFPDEWFIYLFILLVAMPNTCTNSLNKKNI